MDSRAVGGLRLVQSRLDQRAARAKREIRFSGGMQVAAEWERVPDHGYRINCNVSEYAAYPIYQYMRVSPLYRNPDGTWPEVPEGHLVGDRFVAARSNGKGVQWKRLYRPQELRSEDEVLVFLVAHEAFHYLRKTRQVEGRHGEVEADAFALKMLEHYRDGSNIAKTQIPDRR
jgi:hypothetical protein